MKRNYDTIAWFYDPLARLVFGKTLIKAQLYLLNAIPANANILVVGGGTGWILEEITKLHPCGLRITYIDSSAKMIAQAQKRHTGNNEVLFIPAAIEQLEAGHWNIGFGYDVVITPFLFDNLDKNNVEKACTYINSLLVPQGKWLYCDFQNTGLYRHTLLLKVMYAFFRTFCSIEATSLPDVSAFFFSNHYKIIRQKTFFKKFVVSEVYEKG